MDAAEKKYAMYQFEMADDETFIRYLHKLVVPVQRAYRRPKGVQL